MTEQFPRRHPDTAFRQVGNEGGMVVLAETAEVKVLNPVGIKVFSMLDGSHSVDAIIHAVVEQFEVGEAQARQDVQAFLEELQADGLLESPLTAAEEGSP